VVSAAEREINALMALHPKGFDLSLGRITRLLERLGNPHEKLPPVIHIAGTNGKGSTGAFCRAILEAHGLKVHVHTSPHLVNWHERYRLGRGGRRATGWRRCAGRCCPPGRRGQSGRDDHRLRDPDRGDVRAVFRTPADAAVMEVGLGGRFDATNVIANPGCCADHVDLARSPGLSRRPGGTDRGGKGGIIKPGSPVVIGAQSQEAAREVLIETAERHRCPHSVYGQDFLALEENGRLAYQDEDELLDLPLPKLAGRHQQANAAAAIRALKAAGFPVERKCDRRRPGQCLLARAAGTAHAGPAGEAAMDGVELWIDGGHNPGAGKVIAEAMANLEERDSRPLFLITGMINTKDPVGYFEAFAGMARHVFTVPVPDSDAGLIPNFWPMRPTKPG
jgi:dihydrofolate synthase/folylpolyglutamate synthase